MLKSETKENTFNVLPPPCLSAVRVFYEKPKFQVLDRENV
jgi:hypothetical protein